MTNNTYVTNLGIRNSDVEGATRRINRGRDGSFAIHGEIFSEGRAIQMVLALQLIALIYDALSFIFHGTNKHPVGTTPLCKTHRGALSRVLKHVQVGNHKFDKVVPLYLDGKVITKLPKDPAELARVTIHLQDVDTFIAQVMGYNGYRHIRECTLEKFTRTFKDVCERVTARYAPELREAGRDVIIDSTLKQVTAEEVAAASDVPSVLTEGCVEESTKQSRSVLWMRLVIALQMLFGYAFVKASDLPQRIARALTFALDNDTPEAVACRSVIARLQHYAGAYVVAEHSYSREVSNKVYDLFVEWLGDCIPSRKVGVMFSDNSANKYPIQLETWTAGYGVEGLLEACRLFCDVTNLDFDIEAARERVMSCTFGKSLVDPTKPLPVQYVCPLYRTALLGKMDRNSHECDDATYNSLLLAHELLGHAHLSLFSGVQECLMSMRTDNPSEVGKALLVYQRTCLSGGDRKHVYLVLRTMGVINPELFADAVYNSIASDSEWDGWVGSATDETYCEPQTVSLTPTYINLY